MARLNTKLQASGAEFLVLAHLLIEGIEAYKAYTNYPGYDIIATEPSTNRSCRIQVKSRYAVRSWGFPTNNFECDFIICVALNRAFLGMPADSRVGREAWVIYVLPVEVAEAVAIPHHYGRTIDIRRVNQDDHVENWQLIKDFLGRT
jgi:hypothetical protein